MISSASVVASCTERKCRPVPAQHCLGALREQGAAMLASRWWARLGADDGIPRQAAIDLYAGEHWALVRRSLGVLTAAGIAADLWVASAGFGLIPSSAPISPYSATFARDHVDSVVDRRLDGAARRAAHEAWWASLARFPGPAESACRSLQALAARAPRSAMIVIASPVYIAAMRRDLLTAREALCTPDSLIVISNHVLAADAELSRNVIPVDARGRTMLGGTMLGLNARVALTLLEWAKGGPLTVSRLRQRFDDMVGDIERSPSPNRERRSDQEVLSFLRAEVARAPRAGWTPLLKAFRGGGRACEQHRFKALYRQVRAEVSA